MHLMYSLCAAHLFEITIFCHLIILCGLIDFVILTFIFAIFDSELDS